MGIGVALSLAAAAPAAVPAVLVPLTAEPALHRLRPLVFIAVSARTLDLRRFSRDMIAKPDEYRVAMLVASDQEARFTGRKPRKSGMAAGLSLRMTAADGVLASEVGMSGPVGKALTRIALEAVEASQAD